MKIYRLFLVAIFVFLTMLLNGQENRLPKPYGKYSIGVDYLSFTDKSRIELFDNSHEGYREITVKIWYPANSKGEFAPYLENAPFIIENFNFPEAYRDLLTNSSRGVPVSAAENTFPVLIFSHGWGEHFSQNTILMEELASQGYIIFSIGHHYESRFSFYPDGSVITMDMESERFLEIMNEQQNPEALKAYNDMFQAKTDSENFQIFVKTSNLMPLLLKESPHYWAEDVDFLINELENINTSNAIFKHKLNLEQIGVLGMSMGGIATNDVCIHNMKVKAGVNIDGGIYGDAVDSIIQTPYMFINSQRYAGYGDLFVSRTHSDCYFIMVRNSDHYNFTDYALYPVQPDVMVGAIYPAVPIKIMNTMIVAFFDKYLKEKISLDFYKFTKQYDVEFILTERSN